MSEAMDRTEMERRLIERSLEDDAFRQRLLEDPRATMEQELGIQLRAEVQVQAEEETADTIYLVLPSVAPAGEGGEISDRDLDRVTGGMSAYDGFYDEPESLADSLNEDPA